MTINSLSPALSLLLALVVFAHHTQAQESQPEVDVVVVTGHQSGPPLWKVTNGDNTLWVLPLVSVVPKDMTWDDSRVAAIIATSDEVIGSPGVSIGVSKRLLLNPINWWRGPRLFQRVSRNPGKTTLRDVLPPMQWDRYVVLKQKYFPEESDLEKQRPVFAVGQMNDLILKVEKLTDSISIEQHVQKLIRKHKLHPIDVEIEEQLNGSFGELSERLERLVEQLGRDEENACFETRLQLYELHLEEIKQAANAWATGDVLSVEGFYSFGDENDPCTKLLMSNNEGEHVAELVNTSRQRWLAAAEEALAHNHSTFSMLPMLYLSGKLSLVEKLAAKGYVVHVPH